MWKSGETNLPSKRTQYGEQVEAKLRELFSSELSEEEITQLSHQYVGQSYIDVNIPLREDNLLAFVAFHLLLKVQYKKEGTYGRSWCRRGELDVFFNLARKFDRLENIILKGAKDEVGEATIDTVGDLTNYGVLWMTYFIRNYPTEFHKWAESN